MAQELACQNDPLDANLEKVLPSLHEWHKINKDEMLRLKQAVSTVDCKVSDIHSKIDSGFGDIKDILMSDKVQLKQELAGSFLEIAKYLLRDTNGQMSDQTTVDEIVKVSRMTLEQPVFENAAQDTCETSPILETDPAEDHQLYRMAPKHLILLDLVHEWFGTGDYYDEYGGINGRNNLFKARWKKHCCINQMQYSRTMRTIHAVEEYARRNNIDKYIAAEQLQQRYEQCNCSLANFIKWAQSECLLEKKRSRGKHKLSED
jgi:hypothetical protein